MNIKPLFDKVIVKKDAETKQSQSGLILPTEMKDKPKTGIIMSCADNLIVKVGDKVMFGEYSGAKFKHEDDDLIIMRESDIFAVITT